MAKKKIKWTAQQARAISARGSDVLVTASAGTGKTAVLSGRCVDIISDKKLRGDVLGMLVLTFTNAAAEQMRSRIAERLSAAYAETGDKHLRLQLLLLGGADISTIHSFCRKLITEHFHKLGIDPTFQVIESDEQRLLKAEALEAAIEWAWGQNNLTEALEGLLRGRNLWGQEGFLSRIIALSEFLDGVVRRDNWYERAERLAEAVNPLAAESGERQKQIVADRLRQILNQIRCAQRLYEKENPEGDWAAKWQEGFVETVEGCVELLQAPDWHGCTERIRNYQKPTNLQYKPKGLDGPVCEVIRDAAESAKKDFDALGGLAVINPGYLDRVGAAVRGQTRILIELVRRFERVYGQAKRALGCLDFADLEHLALRLLADEDSAEDNLTPSETAMALRQKYRYIFVDEYQDINPVQQAILEMLSGEGNVFVVGDVKQSIYAFRGAEPGIFVSELKTASAEPTQAADGLRVDLNANWRSKKGILDFVNRIFGRIMKSSVADIDYDDSAELRPGDEQRLSDPAAADTASVVEMHILDEQNPDADRQDEQRTGPADDQNRDVVSSRDRQAAMIARRIRQMVGADTGKAEFQICDEQKRLRDVRYEDIVILMRSPAERANEYVQVLQLASVPVSCEVGAGFFEATEIRDMLSLLKVLDNPCRDIELAAALRSPFFGISDTELAKIRIHGTAAAADYADETDLKSNDRKSKNFYDGILEYCGDGPDAKLVERLKQVLGVLQRWRVLARRGSLADLLWQVYRESSYLSFVSALPNGQGRRANLLKLHERAIEFGDFAGSSSVPSLGRFVEFIEKLEEAGERWSGASPQVAGENAVRILSVHKAKGLEFGVVFLAELESRFSSKEFAGDCLIDNAGTLGLRIIESKSNSRLDSIGYQVIEEQRRKLFLAEEMRILYVAMTRARERLVLTGCERKNRCRKVISRGLFFGDGPVADWQLRRCRSHLDWILYGLCDLQGVHKAFETGLQGRDGGDDLFTLRVFDQAELRQLSEYIVGLKRRKPARPVGSGRRVRPKQQGKKLLAEVKRSLGWRYGFGDVSVLPAKQSVTGLTHRSDEYVRIDYSRALDRKPGAVVSAEADLAESIDSRLIGTATHLVLQKLDLSKTVSAESLKQTVDELVSGGYITKPVAEQIDAESIAGFFESDLGRIVLDPANTVFREWPFTFALPACEFSNSSCESRTTSHEPRDTIIVQGIIDMLIKTPKGLIVIDFKTDNITAEEVPQRAEAYRLQLDYYGRTAEAILKHKLLAKWLYFLTPRCEFKIES